jgi:hypothetical protein
MTNYFWHLFFDAFQEPDDMERLDEFKASYGAVLPALLEVFHTKVRLSLGLDAGLALERSDGGV